MSVKPTVMQVAMRLAPPAEPPEGVETIITAPRPARHHHLLWKIGRVLPRDQGFLLSDGTFVNRADAANIAIAAGQITREKMIAATDLFSEDLW